MTAIAETFARCRHEKRAALMPFITCGYPALAEFAGIMECLCNSGADIIEVGFPHSDPLADGPVIQQASHLALERGFTVDRGFAAISAVARRISQPIVVMCYANLILRAGIESFVRRCASHNISGLIVPDMIFEESHNLRSACREHGIDLIPLLTLTTSPLRSQHIVDAATGFIYFVSVTGTTGTRRTIARGLRQHVTKLRRCTSVPVAVGFGISTPEMAGEVASFSEGVIIGSAILKLLESTGTERNYSLLATFLTEARMKLESQR